MIFFAYLDRLPSIPTQLIDSQTKNQLQYQALRQRIMHDGSCRENVDCQRYEVTAELAEWISHNIGESDQTGYQITQPRHPGQDHLVHTDSWPRRWVLNYVLDLGGDNALTCFYRERAQPLVRGILCRPDRLEDLELLYSVRAKAGRWYLLNASVLHDVRNLDSTRRYITVAISRDNPFAALPAYRDMLSW